MKILLVITGLNVGGAERLVTNLADRFASKGHSVTLAFFQGTAELTPIDKNVRVLNLGLTRSPIGVVGGVWRLRKLIISFRPDVVNSHMFHPNIICRLLRIVTDIKILINSAHNSNEVGFLRILAYRFTDFLADSFTNVSSKAVDAFVSLKATRPGHMHVLLNGIDEREFRFGNEARLRIREELGFSSDECVFLAVGRFHEQKDYPNLLSAVSYLVQRGQKFSLIIAGDGFLRKQMEALVSSMDLGCYVRFLGVRHDVPSLMSACDTYVSSSASEGFGLVIAEAMAVERVVIGTDCGGVSEVIGDAGLVVPPKKPLSLANSMERALNLSSNQRIALGHRARIRVVENYSLDKTVQCYLDLYSVTAATRIKNK